MLNHPGTEVKVGPVLEVSQKEKEKKERKDDTEKLHVCIRAKWGSTFLQSWDGHNFRR